MRALRPIIALLFTILWSAPALHAQRSGIGFKAGVLGSTARSELRQFRPLPGAVAGLYFPLGISPRIELQPELLVSYQGSSYSIGETDLRAVERQLYVQIPLKVKFFLSNTFNLQLGGQAGRLLSAWTKDEKDGTRANTSSYADWDLGLVGGVGVDLLSGWDLTLRYYNGLTAILADDDTYFPYNRTLQFTVGYRFVQFRKQYARRH
ncbi:MAG: PorT family protein [Flavobacteriales bacterium]|nr:PorT family protein [Flavobacteriales bacterium]